MNKNTASQKWTVFAFTLSTGAPLTGGAAAITANLRIDDGTASAVTDTNPTEQEDGYYVFDLTQAETNGNKLSIFPASSTAGVQVIGCPAVVFTTPASFQSFVTPTGASVTASTVSDKTGYTVSTVSDKTGYSLSTPPPTVAQIRSEIDSNSTQLSAIVADTNELQTDWANGGRLDLLLDASIPTGVVKVYNGTGW